MKLFRKIDTTTGKFLEDVLFESHPFLSAPGMGDNLVVKVHLIYIPNKCEKDLPI